MAHGGRLARGRLEGVRIRRSFLRYDLDSARIDTGEHFFRAAVAHSALQDFRQDNSVVGGDFQIAWAVTVFRIEARPIGVDFSSIHLASHDEHEARSAVICPEACVFVNSPSEFGHYNDGDPVHFIDEVVCERT